MSEIRQTPTLDDYERQSKLLVKTVAIEREQRARISSLEQTVAKAFLRVKELEEAVKPFAAIKPSTRADGTEFKFYWAVIGAPDKVSFTNEDLARAREVLCHADASRADSPHRAVGALQSDDGEAR